MIFLILDTAVSDNLRQLLNPEQSGTQLQQNSSLSASPFFYDSDDEFNGKLKGQSN